MDERGPRLEKCEPFVFHGRGEDVFGGRREDAELESAFFGIAGVFSSEAEERKDKVSFELAFGARFGDEKDVVEEEKNAIFLLRAIGSVQ